MKGRKNDLPSTFPMQMMTTGAKKYYSRLSINWDRIIRVADYPGRPSSPALPKKGSADCGRWNVREDRNLFNPSYCIGLVQLTLSPTRLQ
ncbi:hypothetical protein AVEN_80178-1 [Araneus ventricosus]|uniref:Uncharacterized protein n=1 Tax=Araneus ventricosus TaxID=182803 RepID=A0A4Y2L154_ARAVE|nr:hypothetical protein AVEN_80178-1 [Araneus ventricosus]